jgi:tol-pal system protein YbgF
VIGAVLALLPVAEVAAQTAAEKPLQQRVERLERVLENQNLSEILLQLQRLQREVLQLRGELEVQGHRLENLQRERGYPDFEPSAGTGPTPAVGEPGDEAPVEAAEPVEPAEPPAEPVEPGPVSGGGTTREQAEYEYEKAFDLLAERRYQEAVEALRAFRDAYPQSRYADLAQYWLGEAYYVTREFEQARQELTRLLDTYPRSPKVPGAMLKLGYIHYEMGQWRQAREQFAQLQEQYPRSTEARLAKGRLEQMAREGR